MLYHRKNEQNTAEVIDREREGYTRMETGYRVLQEAERYSLVEVELHSGKSHQIRALMSWLGHPLLGDVKYGARKTKEKTYQHSVRIMWHFIFRGMRAVCSISTAEHSSCRIPILSGSLRISQDRFEMV